MHALFGRASILTLLQHPTTQQLPCHLNSARAMAEDSVVQDKCKIAISRDDGHFFSNGKVIARRDLHGGMFCGKRENSAIWVIREDWGSPMLAHRFLADVEDGPVGGRTAHHR